MNIVQQQNADLILDTLGVSVLVCDADHEVASVNAAAEDLLGESRRGIQGRSLADLFLDASVLLPSIDKVLHDGGRITIREVWLAVLEQTLMLDVTISAAAEGLLELVALDPFRDVAALEDHRDHIEVLITSWGCPRIDAECIDQLPRLKLIAHLAGSVKGFLDDVGGRRGIRVRNASR